MSVQRTFRDVAKPKIAVHTNSLVGGVLPLGEATMFLFSNNAVSAAITSLSGHEYLINGQPLYFVNSHPSMALQFTIGAFSHSIPAGYGETLYFDEANTSFRRFDKSEVKGLRDSIAANVTAISNEATARTNEDLTFVKLDGSRALTGNLDLNSNKVLNLANGVGSSDAINKGQLDTAYASLEAMISANASSLSWRSPVDIVTARPLADVPVNGEALADQSGKLFGDDEAPTVHTTANIAVDTVVLFAKAGQEPKLMVVRDNLGTKRWYDHTETDPALKLNRQLAAGDTFIVKSDLIDSPDSAEGSAMYHIVAGTPKTAIKIGDLDWDQATGITISGSYIRGAGDQTIVQGDSVELALQKLDGNIEKNKTDAATALSTAIATEVSDRNTAISTAIAQEVLDRNAAITSSQNTQDSKLASTSAGEGAALVGINDALSIISATTVEGALQENRQKIDQNEADITGLQADVSLNTTNIANNASDIAQVGADLAQLESDLASTAAAKGASMIGIEDVAGNFAGSTVEDALAELDQKVDSLNLVNMRRGLHEAAATGATSLDLTTSFKDIVGVGGVVQDLSAATYLNAFVIRDGAVLIGGVGYTISGTTLTLTAAGGGELLVGEIVEVRIVEIA
ncbi:MAG: hypothetical protein PHY47_00235 [Lachnospiraceae bacterium]|nr:hypothetical protein [Lachnospiraceae bacterium]